ncbi:MAG: subclass B1 metallo-beta-lactamase, partial [Candidatus Azobacteroides sp.]|nr:subclass B1 metallo-beta-lactamase [Candidatus Azobacteroides sp.]
GGYGTYIVAMDFPDKFAAIVPLCGGINDSDTSRVCNMRNIPIWTFHGTADDKIPISETERIVSELRKCNGEIKFTRLQNEGHAIQGLYEAKPQIYKWLLKHQKTNTGKEVYKSETLVINQISEHVYQHISFLNTKDFGKVSCNGMIVACKNETVIFDTPPDDETARELIDWVTKSLKCKITALIPTHYHIDNLGGLDEFHRQGIASYAYNKTIQITKEKGLPVPQHGFDKYLDLKVGNEKVHVEFFGEGHTCDNVVGYFPAENIMFGGCLIKEVGAGKGNLEEANVKEWSATVKKVKEKYPKVKTVIPGHGQTGGSELLDYTINLFK